MTKRVQFHVGDTVFVKSLGTIATVERIVIDQGDGARTVVGYEFSDLGGGTYGPADLMLIKRSSRGLDAEFLQQAMAEAS